MKLSKLARSLTLATVLLVGCGATTGAGTVEPSTAAVTADSQAPTVTVTRKAPADQDDVCYQAVKAARIVIDTAIDNNDAFTEVFNAIHPALVGASQLDGAPIEALNRKLDDASAVVKASTDKVVKSNWQELEVQCKAQHN